MEFDVHLGHKYYIPLELDDEGVGISPDRHSLAGTLVLAASWTVPWIVLIKQFTAAHRRYISNTVLTIFTSFTTIRCRFPCAEPQEALGVHTSHFLKYGSHNLTKFAQK